MNFGTDVLGYRSLHARITVGGHIVSGQAAFEQQMKARALIQRPRPERALQTVVCVETRPYPKFEEPEVSFKAMAIERDVKRGLAATRDHRAVLLAYGIDCVRGLDVFGPWGNLAPLAPTSAELFRQARQRSHRRQREIDAWLSDLALRARHGDDDAELAAKRIARSCDRLLEDVTSEFLRGVRGDASRAA